LDTGSRVRAILIWAALAAVIGVPLALAATSELIQWRTSVYIIAAFAGVAGLGLMLVQPLLVGGYLPGLSAYRARRVHHWIGGAIVAAVVIHVAGLWFTSPPDMIDALTFTSPTLFSHFGVVAMWAIFAVTVLAAVRRRLGLRTFRIAHMSLAAVIVSGTVIHGLLIEGTMETMSKAALCVLVVLAAIKVMTDLLLRTRRTVPREGVAQP
jgi:predicted ferric reductase